MVNKFERFTLLQYRIRGLSGKYPAIFEYPENRSRSVDVTW